MFVVIGIDTKTFPSGDFETTTLAQKQTQSNGLCGTPRPWDGQGGSGTTPCARHDWPIGNVHSDPEPACRTEATPPKEEHYNFFDCLLRAKYQCAIRGESNVVIDTSADQALCILSSASSNRLSKIRVLTQNHRTHFPRTACASPSQPQPLLASFLSSFLFSPPSTALGGRNSFSSHRGYNYQDRLSRVIDG